MISVCVLTIGLHQLSIKDGELKHREIASRLSSEVPSAVVFSNFEDKLSTREMDLPLNELAKKRQWIFSKEHNFISAIGLPPQHFFFGRSGESTVPLPYRVQNEYRVQWTDRGISFKMKDFALSVPDLMIATGIEKVEYDWPLKYQYIQLNGTFKDRQAFAAYLSKALSLKSAEIETKEAKLRIDPERFRKAFVGHLETLGGDHFKGVDKKDCEFRRSVLVNIVARARLFSNFVTDEKWIDLGIRDLSSWDKNLVSEMKKRAVFAVPEFQFLILPATPKDLYIDVSPGGFSLSIMTDNRGTTFSINRPGR